MKSQKARIGFTQDADYNVETGQFTPQKTIWLDEAVDFDMKLTNDLTLNISEGGEYQFPTIKPDARCSLIFTLIPSEDEDDKI